MPQRLGQHFLTNTAVLREIVDALDLHAGETVIEIGPGHGELTKVIGDRFEVIEKAEKGMKKKSHIIAIEKDTQFVLALGKKFASDSHVEIVRGDVLDILSELPRTHSLKPGNWKIAGNIPYYITGHLLRVIGELAEKPACVVFTVQREVAERICADPPRMNKLAASIQFWAEPRLVRIVPRGEFRPVPKVDSAIILLHTRPKDFWGVPAERYFSLVRMLFAQPRKTIFNNLRSAGTTEGVAATLENAKILPTARPQDVHIEQIALLAKALGNGNLPSA